MTGADDVRRAVGLPARHPALSVACPGCRAAPGEPCRSPRGRQLTVPHPSRREVA